MTVRVPIGPVAAVPVDSCIAIADGRAIALRVGDEVCAFQNRCVHQDSPLAGGLVRDGVLSCPLHFWRYHAHSGQLIGTGRALDRYRVEVIDGEAYVHLPDPPPTMSLRDQLLQRARHYDRDAAWRADTGDTGDTGETVAAPLSEPG